MAGDEQVDFIARALDDIDNRAGNTRAFVVSAGWESAFMDDHYNGLDTLFLQFRNESINRIGFIVEVQHGYPGRSHDSGRAFQGHADEGDLNAFEGLDLIGRENGLAILLPGHILCQEAEVCTGKIVTIQTAVHRMAATLLHADQLVDPLIELMISHGIEVQTHQVKGLDGGFIVEKGRNQGAGADHVACRNKDRVGICSTQVIDMSSQILDPTGVD